MSKMVNNEYAYVHDNTILSYNVDVYNMKLEMKTAYYDEEQTDITFTNLIGHRFENVTYSNIINSIKEISIDDFINQNKEMLENGFRYAFPICASDCEELRAHLHENKQRIFIISAVLGLCGFVIAKDISIDVKK